MTRLGCDSAILSRAEPALRRLPGQADVWVPSPPNPIERTRGARCYASGADVRRLVRQGALRFGNSCHTFVVLRDASPALLGTRGAS